VAALVAVGVEAAEVVEDTPIIKAKIQAPTKVKALGKILVFKAAQAPRPPTHDP